LFNQCLDRWLHRFPHATSNIVRRCNVYKYTTIDLYSEHGGHRSKVEYFPHVTY